MCGGVYPGGDILALLLGYLGAQLLSHLPALPGDGVLPLLVIAELVQQVHSLPLVVCLL